jgi:phosphoribosylaminoimidazole carboxylase PurE protein
MVAALTILPVIGVPIAVTALQGQDSLLSIVQMPKGIPVATVAIDNAANAALLAAQIIAVSNNEVAAKLQAFRENQTATVMEKVKAMES